MKRSVISFDNATISLGNVVSCNTIVLWIPISASVTSLLSAPTLLSIDAPGSLHIGHFSEAAARRRLHML